MSMMSQFSLLIAPFKYLLTYILEVVVHVGVGWRVTIVEQPSRMFRLENAWEGYHSVQQLQLLSALCCEGLVEQFCQSSVLF